MFHNRDIRTPFLFYLVGCHNNIHFFKHKRGKKNLKLQQRERQDAKEILAHWSGLLFHDKKTSLEWVFIGAEKDSMRSLDNRFVSQGIIVDSIYITCLRYRFVFSVQILPFFTVKVKVGKRRNGSQSIQIFNLL